MSVEGCQMLMLYTWIPGRAAGHASAIPTAFFLGSLMRGLTSLGRLFGIGPQADLARKVLRRTGPRWKGHVPGLLPGPAGPEVQGWANVVAVAGQKAAYAAQAAQLAATQARNFERLGRSAEEAAADAVRHLHALRHDGIMQLPDLRPLAIQCGKLDAYVQDHPERGRDPHILQEKGFCGGLQAYVDMVAQAGSVEVVNAKLISLQANLNRSAQQRTITIRAPMAEALPSSSAMSFMHLPLLSSSLVVLQEEQRCERPSASRKYAAKLFL